MNRISRLFLQALGFIYLLHFASIIPQIKGLIGVQGIEPAKDYLARAQTLWLAPLQLPTLAWISTQDGFLIGLAIAGVILAVCLIAGCRHFAILTTLWLIHLSFCNLPPFMTFIWDSCLAQAGFASLFFATRSWKFNEAPAPPKAALWAARFVFFHVMYMMWECKAFSKDPSWHDLTFLHWFYQNQPMPSVVSWALFQLPNFWTKASSLGVLLLEGIVSAAVFIPARYLRLREIAFCLSVLLQSTIFIIGNYGYFNLLMIALSLFYLQDESLKRWLPYLAKTKLPAHRSPKSRKPWIATVLVSLFIVSNVSVYFLDWHLLFQKRSGIAYTILRPLVSYRIVAAYDLFGSVPHVRREIQIEKSDNGENWQEYTFLYRPGPLDRMPALRAPFQWRLDHEFYYASAQLRPLSKDDASKWYVDTDWLHNFANRILSGEASVPALLQTPESSPPRMIRLKIYEYEFTDIDELRQTGNWWKRNLLFQTEPITAAQPMEMKTPFLKLN